MKIKVNWEVSHNQGTEHFTLEDLNCRTEQEWNDLSDDEKRERVQSAIDDLPSGPVAIVNDFYVKKD